MKNSRTASIHSPEGGTIPGLRPEEQQMLNRIATRCYMAYVKTGFGDSFTREDFLHQGLIGLLEARRRFDPQRGVSFVTFAEQRVFGAIQDWLRKLPTVPVPQKKWQEVKQLQKAQEETIGEDDQDKAVQDYLAWDQEKVEQVRQYVPQMVFIDHQPDREDDDHAPFQLADTNGISPEEAYLRQDLREALHGCMKISLSAEERHIIISRILHGTTLKDLARTYGCSIEWVRRRQLKAQALLKKCLEEKGYSVEEGDEYNIAECL